MVSLPTRRTLGALVALAAYAYALTVGPWLHAARHALRGADHIHGAAGLVALDVELEHAHAAFHEDLAGLGLGDVADAGVLAVDCSLAVYTLSACGDAATPAHAPRFGDEVAARHRTAPPDPSHGAGSLEHFAAALHTATPPLLPPPHRRTLPRVAPLVEAQRGELVVREHLARGPPPLLA